MTTNTNELQLSSLKQRVQYALERAGLTQRDLAKKRKVSEQAVSKWLIAGRIPWEHQEAVANLLQVSVGWMTHGETPRGEQAAVVEVPIITWESVTGRHQEVGKTWTVGVPASASMPGASTCVPSTRPTPPSMGLGRG